MSNQAVPMVELRHASKVFGSVIALSSMHDLLTSKAGKQVKRATKSKIQLTLVQA